MKIVRKTSFTEANDHTFTICNAKNQLYYRTKKKWTFARLFNLISLLFSETYDLYTVDRQLVCAYRKINRTTYKIGHQKVTYALKNGDRTYTWQSGANTYTLYSRYTTQIYFKKNDEIPVNISFHYTSEFKAEMEINLQPMNEADLMIVMSICINAYFQRNIGGKLF